MRKYFFMTIVALCTLSACQENIGLSTSQETFDSPIEKKSDSHKVSMQEAVDELNAFLQQMHIETPLTRSGKAFTTDDIVCVTRNYSETRATLTEIDNNVISDTALYLINFGDKSEESGYAVLSPDNRAASIILAVTEKGYISQEDFLFDTNYDYEDNEELQDFEFYNPTDDDYYVASTSVDDNISYVMLMQCTDRDLLVEDAGGGGGSFSSQTTDWEYDKTVSPMLTTLWKQGWPFNKACPIKKDGEPAPVGCVAIALGQIMAYHELPGGNMTFNGVACNWPDMKSVFPKLVRPGASKYGTESQQDQVAQFLKHIGSWCDMRYFSDFAFATPRAAQNTMDIFGYENVKRTLSYKETEIVNMLDNGNPVFIAAISGIKNGHAWVIDGYKRQSRYVNGVKKYKYYFHCSWGWGGFCDGYYQSGVFDLRNGAVEPDNTEEETRDRDYDWWFRIITYNNPND